MFRVHGGTSLVSSKLRNNIYWSENKSPYSTNGVIFGHYWLTVNQYIFFSIVFIFFTQWKANVLICEK